MHIILLCNIFKNMNPIQNKRE